MADGKVVIDIEADSSGFESEIDDVEKEAKNAADGLDELGDSAKKAGDGLDVANIAAGTFVADGVKALIAAVGNAVSSLMTLADETREYREDMAKLETAFSTAGHSTDTASKAYEDFYAILGESDRSVEAVNHLAELTKNEQAVAKWSTIAAGVTAKFGDSLPIEGLTEAANETAKVGKVTGPLADALNWAGISEDEFNKKLEACNSEQERATLITDTLNSKYQAAADEYNELTASTQDARRATSAMEEAQANLGAAIEPVTTAWTNLKANALEAILPVVETVAEKIQDLSKWMEENPEKAEVLKGVIIGIAAAVGVLVVAFGGLMIVNTLKAAFVGLGAAMGTAFLPVTLIVAGIAALVAGFIYLWNNCEGFREFWIGLWEGIKTAAQAVADWFVTAWTDTIDWLKDAWTDVEEFFADTWKKIQDIFAPVVKWFGEIFSKAWGGIKVVWDKVSGYFSLLWDTIKTIFSVVKDVLSGNFSDAWAAIKRIVDKWEGYFSGVWDDIKTVFSSVTSWFSEKFQAAWDGITNIWDAVSGYFSDLYDDIVGAFDGIVDDFFAVGDNIVTGIWDGISAGWDWLVNKVKSLASALFGAAQEELDSHSPSRKFAWLGETAPQGLGVGWERAMPDVEDQIMDDIDGLTANIRATVAAENGKAGTMGARDTGVSDLAQAMGAQSAGISSLASEYRRGSTNKRPVILMLDKRELGRAMVDCGGAEESRVGVKLVTGGA